MFDRERTLYAFLLGYARQLVEGIDDARFADQPSPGINPPAWQVGHLTVVADSGCRLLGLPRECPREWQVAFGPRSEPTSDRAAYPGKAELWSTYEATHARLDAAARDASPEAMAAPNEHERLKAMLPTVGDVLAHILTTHEAMHLGHLSSWRRQVGLPPLF